MSYEYRVLPAPVRGVKSKGVKTADDRFANALQMTMNEMGAAGWEYQRTDTLPCEEREGLMGKTTVYKNMLVFRRPLAAEVAETPTDVPLMITAATEPATEPTPEEDDISDLEKLDGKPLDDDPRPEPKLTGAS